MDQAPPTFHNILIISGVCVVQLCTAILLPGIGIGSLLSIFVLTAAAILVLSLSPLRGRGATWVIAAVALFLGCGVIINTWYYTTAFGYTLSEPLLVNYDSQRWWNDALIYLGRADNNLTLSGQGCFGAVLAAVLGVFGISVATACVFSMALVLGSLIISGITAYRLIGSRRTAVLAMVCTAAVCYWLTMGTLLLKEPFIFLAMATAAYGLTCRGLRMSVLVLVSCAMLAAARPNYIIFVIIGLALVPRHEVSPWGRAATAVVAAAILAGVHIATMQPDVVNVVTAHRGTHIHYDSPNQMALTRIIGDYPDIPWYNKLALLPVTAFVQFLIPFPWSFMRDVPYGPTELWAHIAYPWYIFGIVLIYYIYTVIRSRQLDTTTRMALWGLLCWLVPCYLFGGTISRYGLPMVALMAPAVALTLKNYANLRSFRIYLAVSAVILSACLTVCHHLQSKTGFETTALKDLTALTPRT